MFKIGDRVVFKQNKDVKAIIYHVFDDNKIIIEKRKNLGNTHYMISSDIVELDKIYYRKKKLNNILKNEKIF